MSCILYGFPLSQNSYKVRLLLALQQSPYEERTVDLRAGEHRQAWFLKINPLGQVPVMVDGQRTIRDSHAILIYLAQKTPHERWYSADAYEQALINQWLFFNANDVHNGIGLARNHYAFGVPLDGAAAKMRGMRALQVLDQQLHRRDWLECDRPTLADIACYPLVTVANEAQIALSAYPAVCQWLARVESLPGYVPPRRLAQ